MYFNQINQLIKQYRVVVEKLSKMKNKKKYAIEIPDLLLERTSLKEAFIAKKQAARANISLLKEGLDVLKDKECVFAGDGGATRAHSNTLRPAPFHLCRLREIQEEYRVVDSEFKELCVLPSRKHIDCAPPSPPSLTRTLPPSPQRVAE